MADSFFNVEDFVQSILSQLDRVQDALRLKAVNRPLTYALKDISLDFHVFAELDVPMSGGTVVIDHGHGVTSSFLHLSSISKKVGDVVTQGDVVAKSGSTGRATGPHLDWRMSYFEVRIDPELLVPPRPAK